ncbi:probable E3 ubiquitin-protein ligase RNF4 at C-terminar half [Coccomyxa sp. Obi]|nr:probable E3 ubiquitin-protein ligase RNF4 at C-terminar half [Coccomyxa sp. Obi]
MSVTSPQHIQPALILLDSDDDEQAGPSGRPAPSRQKSANPARALRSPGNRRPQVRSNPVTARQRGGTPGDGGNDGPVIDLTSSSPVDDDVVLLSASPPPRSGRKRRRVSLVIEQDPPGPPPSKDKQPPDPQCAVCLESMAEMSCGPCGHVFCDSCLRAAVRAQKKCPTCRKVIHLRQIHRVYLNV